MELPEMDLLRRVFHGRFAALLIILHIYRPAQRGIGRRPHLRVGPVRRFRRAIDHGIECRVVLSAFQLIHCLAMHLVADRVSVAACRGDDEVQRLLARSARALRHGLVQLTVALTQQLVKDAGVNVIAVLAGHLAGQRLIDAVRGHVHHPLLRVDDPDALP